MIIKTKGFEIAVYNRGNEDCSKLALAILGSLDTEDYARMGSHVDFRDVL